MSRNPVSGGSGLVPNLQRESVTQVRMSSRSALRQHAAEWDAPSVLDLLIGPEWKEQAACRNKPQSWWFPNQGNESKASYIKARAVCGACPVRLQCFNHAMDLPEKVGMWGGTSPKERQYARRSQFARNSLEVRVRKAQWEPIHYNPRASKGRNYGELKARCYRLHDAGLRNIDIANELHVAPSTVAMWLLRRHKA